jgi:CheY-like chemotaxis protein
MLLELALLILEPAGFQVRTFRDPLEVIANLQTSDTAPDLVITDYSMERMSGLELMQRCRDLRPGQKVLVLSGTVDQEFFEHPAGKPDRFLAKPYQAEELIQAVREMTAA